MEILHTYIVATPLPVPACVLHHCSVSAMIQNFPTALSHSFWLLPSRVSCVLLCPSLLLLLLLCLILLLVVDLSPTGVVRPL